MIATACLIILAKTSSHMSVTLNLSSEICMPDSNYGRKHTKSVAAPTDSLWPIFMCIKETLLDFCTNVRHPKARLLSRGSQRSFQSSVQNAVQPSNMKPKSWTVVILSSSIIIIIIIIAATNILYHCCIPLESSEMKHEFQMI